MIKREDLKVGDTVRVFNRYLFDVPVESYVTKISCHDKAVAIYFTENNKNVVKHDGTFFFQEECQLIKKKPRTVEFFEWIDVGGYTSTPMVTREGITIKGDNLSYFKRDFLAWTDRSFHLEVGESWGVEE
jgi:hypothetical protein